MTTAHWHLLLNHIPVISILTGFLLLLAGLIMKNPVVKRCALGIFMFAAVFAIPAFLTGEGAEEEIEKIAATGESFIEHHENLADIFTWLSALLGILSALTFMLDVFNRKIVKLLFAVVLVLSAGSLFFAKQVATSGGEIRHTEIRKGADANVAANGEKRESSKEASEEH